MMIISPRHTLLEQSIPSPLSHRQQAVLGALDQKRFFKLIAGGSLSELDKIRRLANIYARAGVDCIDIAPLPEAIQAVCEAFDALDTCKAPHPLLMVSLPLDPDPHFRKIELSSDDCIACSLCVPVCPSDTFRMDNTQTLLVEEPLCYGCGRCVPACPTGALSLHPFLLQSTLAPVLSHPLVEAVELHTQHADPFMLENFLAEYGPWLENKLLAYCFRPNEAQESFWKSSIQRLANFAPGRVFLQVDGAPMSGNEEASASVPAIENARYVQQALLSDRELADLKIPITISGGINRHSAYLIRDSENTFIAGAGMGTVARKAIWHFSLQETGQAVAIARHIVAAFKK